MSFVKGKYAYGYCDKCGSRWPINDLKFETENMVLTKRRTCPDCFDEDHPQNLLGKLRIYDPMSIKDARPETGIENSRGYFGWPQVGHELIYLTVAAGDVSVTVA
jgi:hydrogenase maturation factor HypF (carbamoyltransferase family)